MKVYRWLKFVLVYLEGLLYGSAVNILLIGKRLVLVIAFKDYHVSRGQAPLGWAFFMHTGRMDFAISLVSQSIGPQVCKIFSWVSTFPVLLLERLCRALTSDIIGCQGFSWYLNGLHHGRSVPMAPHTLATSIDEIPHVCSDKILLSIIHPIICDL